MTDKTSTRTISERGLHPDRNLTGVKLAIVTATETVIGTNQFQKIGIPNKFSEIVVTSQSSRILIMASPNTEEAKIHKWYHRTQAG